jgi:hypothetical protein
VEPFSQEAWTASVARAALDVKLMIPVYADTTLEEWISLWKSRIPLLKEEVYPNSHAPQVLSPQRSTRRKRPEQYAKRLRVWDVVQECPTFAQAAKRLRMKESTLKGVYMMAARDILGAPDSRKPRERVLAGFDPQTHSACTICQKAQRFEELCPQARAYASQDEGSMLGNPSNALDQLPDILS